VRVVGVALNPNTPIEPLAPVLDELDMVLVMSVFPGFGGQRFMEQVLAKVEWLVRSGYRGHIEMDGGLNAETLPRCAAAGATVLVAGSAMVGAQDRAGTIASFRRSAETALARPEER
jgi:ribulose-phosphate 3-epimerase